MWYRLAKALLFRLPTERSHHIAMQSLQWLARLRLLPWLYPTPKANPVTVMGLSFPNRVGLAAGLDKNGDYLAGLSALGFGFIEIGTVTPKPQPGNPAPRLFRLPEQQAIINRMGFNNEGVAQLLENVAATPIAPLLGINIGKNKLTDEADAVQDYLYCFEQVYQYADYITINISSPNTPGLRALQFGEPLRELLAALKDKQAACTQQYQRYVPMAVKVAPDLTESEVNSLAETFTEFNVDGVIATNTTMSREKVAGHPLATEAGGLSGAPLRDAATEIIRQFYLALPETIPIIAVGGIMSATDAEQKLAAGARLVQIYSGFIYRGPGLVAEVIRATAR